MKKKLILFCLGLFGISSLGNAQLNITGQAGLNYASVSTDDSDVSELLGTKLGYFIGAQVSKDLNDKLYFTAGANFSSKGFSSEFVVDIPGFYKSEFTGTSSLNYLEIPLNIGYKIGDRVTVQAGPYLGFLMGVSNYSKSTETDYINGGTTVVEETDNDKTGISSTDFGLNVGLGFNLSESLALKVNYGFGMADLNDDAAATYYIKNNVSSVGIAYTFKK
jgi:hypothetical protein